MLSALITEDRAPVAGIAHLRVAGLLIAIVLVYYTEHTPFGRQIHAVGTRSGSRASASAGIGAMGFAPLSRAVACLLASRLDASQR